MATNELVSKLNELTELRRMAEDISAEIEAIQNEIKAHMTESDTDTITAGAFKVTWKAVISTRIDTAALRKDLPEIWHEYGKGREYDPGDGGLTASPLEEMTMKKLYTDTAANLLCNMRIRIEGIVQLYEDDAALLQRLAETNDMLTTAASSLM